MSSNNSNSLTVDRKPKFEKKTLFLETLIDGEASLYKYQKGNIYYYYLSKNNEVTPLIFKKYLIKNSSTSAIKENNRYKNQLYTILGDCRELQEKKFLRLKYTQKDLSKLISEYNNCKNQEYISYLEKNKINFTESFNLKVKAGALSQNISHIDPDNFINNEVQFDNSIGVTFGFEIEYLLPYRNSKWSLILESRYSNLSTETRFENSNFRYDGTYRTLVFEYNRLETAIGVRHKFFLNNKFSLFGNALLNLTTPLNSSFKAYEENTNNIIYTNPLANGPTPSAALGLGIDYKNKFSVEIRYKTGTNIMGKSGSIKLNYIGLVASYNLF